MDRRRFLAQSSKLALMCAALPSCGLLSAKHWLVCASKDKQGDYFVAAIDLNGNLINKIKIPERGHDAIGLPHKPGHALVFGRRPERFALEVDFLSGKVVKHINSQVDTHFFGHGVLSTDGSALYTAENLYDRKKGVIVVRDSTNYQVINRFDSHGIGPHQLKLMPDGTTLVVANGGILTHPDWPRMKLNLDTMQPNLTYMNRHTGELIERVTLNDHQLSLRHLDVNSDGVVVVGAQYQGDKSQVQPLVFKHQFGTSLIPFDAEESVWKSMQQYTASVVLNKDFAFVSCPRGNVFNQFDLNSNALIKQFEMPDVAGLADSPKGLFASSGTGLLKQIEGINDKEIVRDNNHQSLLFDNHMTVILGA